MKVNTVNIQTGKKENFNKLFKLKDNSTSKLEFKYNGTAYEIKYDNEDLGWYSSSNQDQMILNFLEALADYNGGDESEVKAKLDHLVEYESPVLHQQYQTTYKNNQ